MSRPQVKEEMTDLDKAVERIEQGDARDETDEEVLLLVDDNGEENGLSAPRRLCHTIGLRHGSIHVALWAPDENPGMLLQVRSRAKKEFPCHLELAATGHAGISGDWEAAAYRELNEEIGISRGDLAGDLIFVGTNFQVYDEDDRYFHNREFVRIFTQRLTEDGLNSMRLNRNEVEKVLFIDEDELGEIADIGLELAPGLLATLPVYMEWFERNRTLLF